MYENITVYHRNGTQITITNIPKSLDGSLSFEIMTRLEQQIDEINSIAEPQPFYEFK